MQVPSSRKAVSRSTRRIILSIKPREILDEVGILDFLRAGFEANRNVLISLAISQVVE